jgi:hypothetical protein
VSKRKHDEDNGAVTVITKVAGSPGWERQDVSAEVAGCSSKAVDDETAGGAEDDETARGLEPARLYL